MMTALVSIVIPTYNRASDLKHALASVMAQTYQNWECLVVDNHSTDETDAVIQRFNDNRIQCYKIHNQGIIAASRNMGLRKARGEYIAFLDSDDCWKPNKLAASVAYLEKGADIVFHDLFRMKSRTQRFFLKKMKTREVVSPVWDDLVENGNALNNSSVVLRRAVLERVGRLSESSELVGAEDYELWLRIAQITEKFVRVPAVLGYYFASKNSMFHQAKAPFARLDKIKEVCFFRDNVQRVPVWWKVAYFKSVYRCKQKFLNKEAFRDLYALELSLRDTLKVALFLVKRSVLGFCFQISKKYMKLHV